MKQFSCWQAIYKAFYSRDLYRDVVKNWDVDVVLYLLYILAVCWIIALINTQNNFIHQFNREINGIVAQIPEIIVKDGVAKTKINHPYTVKNPVSNEVIMVIDTSGRYQHLKQINTPLLITKTKAAEADGNATEPLIVLLLQQSSLHYHLLQQLLFL